MSLVGSLPFRGSKIVDENGQLTESFSKFLTDLYESNNNDNPQNNFRATGAPLVTDNRDKGYTVGSEWIDSPTVYKLTSFTGTDAVWTALN